MTEPSSTPTSMTQHGVMLEVLSLGILLIGQSGIGKSEIALNLITRGHKLIADDAITLTLSDNALIATCPPLLVNFLEIRGVGILDIEAMYGEQAVSQSHELDLIVNLVDLSDQLIKESNRFHGIHRKRTLLGIDIPEVVIPVGPGRPQAILVEAAVRNHKLKLDGYNPKQRLRERQLKLMKDT